MAARVERDATEAEMGVVAERIGDEGVGEFVEGETNKHREGECADKDDEHFRGVTEDREVTEDHSSRVASD